MLTQSSNQANQTVGAKLRAARLAKKYTQGRLAQPDFSVSYISAIERGQIQPSLRALDILARRLGITATELLPKSGQLLVELARPASNVTDNDELNELLLLEAEIALHRRNVTEALSLLQSLSSQKNSKLQELAVSYLLGQTYLAGGYIQEGERTLAGAARLARELDDARYPWILHLQGDIYAAMHNYTQSFQLQNTCLQVLQQRPESSQDNFLLARVYNSLGNHYSQLSDYTTALEMYSRALEFLPEPNDYAQYKEIYKTLARQSSLVTSFSGESLYNYKWLQADLQAALPQIKGKIQHVLGRTLLKSNPAEAERYLHQLLQQAETNHDGLGQASAHIHLATLALNRQDLSEAQTHLQAAELQAQPFGETLIQADAFILQGELAYADQNYQAGDDYFERGLAVLEKVAAHEELLEQLTRYAALLEKSGSIQKSIRFWKLAYAYRQKN